MSSRCYVFLYLFEIIITLAYKMKMIYEIMYYVDIHEEISVGIRGMAFVLN